MQESKPVRTFDDGTYGPIGVHPTFAQHSDVQMMDVYHSLWKCCSAGADVYPHGQGKVDEKQGVSPFTVKGKRMGGFTIYAGPTKDTLLYDIEVKYRSWKMRFNVKDANGKVVAEIKGSTSCSTYLIITFANAASGQHEQRQWSLKRSEADRHVCQLYEGENVIATFQRPGYKMSKSFVSEPRVLTVSPNVDVSFALVIYLCRYTQVLMQYAAIGSTSAGSAGVAAAVIS